MLEFWNLNDIEKVYKWKQNLIKKTRKSVGGGKKYEHKDIKNFLLAKKYIKIENWQTFYILENLVIESKYKWFDNKPVFINLWLKELDKIYKDNYKLLTKYKKLENKKIDYNIKINSIFNKEKFKSKINEYNSKISKIDKELLELKPKVFFY